MKTLITSKGNTAEATFDQRFGRAAYFCIYHSDTLKTEYIQNSNAEDEKGVGSDVAQKIIEMGVQRVISGDFGPQAYHLLNEAGIQMVIIPDEEKKIQQILRLINSNL